MSKKYLIFIVILTILSIQTVKSQTTIKCDTYCKDSTLYIGFTNFFGICEHRQIKCQYGCKENTCVCPDYCSGDTLYSNGKFDIKALKCVYDTKECEYGCKTSIINREPSCSLYPEKPPIENETKMYDILFKMLKGLYERDINNIGIKVKGTRYKPNQDGKVFLQLLDNQHQPIENASCFTSIIYPDGFSKWKDEEFMTYTFDGLYFYPFKTPATTGVYMVSAYCIIPNPNWILYNSYDGFESNSISGGSGDWNDDWYLEGNAHFTTNEHHSGSYSLRLRGGNGYADRPANSSDDVDSVVVTFWAKANSLESSDYGYFTFCGNDDTNNCTTLQTWTNGDDDNIWHYYSFTMQHKDFNWSKKVWVEFDATDFSGSGDYLYIDDLNITMIQKTYNTTEYQKVRGSGEVVVEDDDLYDYYFSDGRMDLNDGNEFGGTAYLNLTIVSHTFENRSVDITISGFDYYYCTDILEFRKWNGSEWINITDYECYYDSSVGQSTLKFTQDFEKGEIYQYYFKLRNKWYRTFDFIYSGINKTETIARQICEWYYNKTGKAMPEIPLNVTTQDCADLDDVQCWCSHILETIYQARVKRQYADSINTSTLSGMYQYLETLTEIDRDIRPNYDTYVNQLFQYIILSSDFNEVFDRLGTFGNESSTYKIWLWTLENENISNDVWNYHNRTLTDYNQTEILELLKQINLTTDDIRIVVYNISDTTSATFDLLYNLSIGNVTVSAYINWTRLTQEVWNKTNPYKIRHDLLSLSDNKIQLVTTTDMCIDNKTLQHNINVTNCILGNCYSYNYTTTEICPYGCAEHQCKPSKQTSIIIALIIALVISIILVFVWRIK